MLRFAVSTRRMRRKSAATFIQSRSPGVTARTSMDADGWLEVWMASDEAPGGDRTRLVLTADGTSLAVREIGSQMAPVTVIFAHGFCLHMDAWAPQRAYLAMVWRGRARLVFFDHRGHGGSGAADTDSYTISQLGRDLDAVIRTVAPQGPIVLVGHSMGGMAVMSYVAHHQEAAAAQVVGVGLISTAVDNVAGAGIGRALNTPAVTLLRSASAHAPPGSSGAAGISHVASCRRWSAQLARLLRVQVSVPPPRLTGWSTRRRSPPWPPSCVTCGSTTLPRRSTCSRRCRRRSSVEPGTG